MKQDRPGSGREVSDENAGAAIGIRDDGVNLAVAKIEPQARPPPAQAGAAVATGLLAGGPDACFRPSIV